MRYFSNLHSTKLYYISNNKILVHEHMENIHSKCLCRTFLSWRMIKNLNFCCVFPVSTPRTWFLLSKMEEKIKHFESSIETLLLNNLCWFDENSRLPQQIRILNKVLHIRSCFQRFNLLLFANEKSTDFVIQLNFFCLAVC